MWIFGHIIETRVGTKTNGEKAMKRESYDLEGRLSEFAVQSIDIAEALP